MQLLEGAHQQESPQIAMGWFDAGNDRGSLVQVKEVPSHPLSVESQVGDCFHAHTEVLALKLHAPHLRHLDHLGHLGHLGHLSYLGHWGQLDHLAEEHLCHVDNLDC